MSRQPAQNEGFSFDAPDDLNSLLGNAMDVAEDDEPNFVGQTVESTPLEEETISYSSPKQEPIEDNTDGFVFSSDSPGDEETGDDIIVEISDNNNNQYSAAQEADFIEVDNYTPEPTSSVRLQPRDDLMGHSEPTLEREIEEPRTRFSKENNNDTSHFESVPERTSERERNTTNNEKVHEKARRSLNTDSMSEAAIEKIIAILDSYRNLSQYDQEAVNIFICKQSSSVTEGSLVYNALNADPMLRKVMAKIIEASGLPEIDRAFFVMSIPTLEMKAIAEIISNFEELGDGPLGREITYAIGKLRPEVFDGIAATESILSEAGR